MRLSEMLYQLLSVEPLARENRFDIALVFLRLLRQAALR